MAAQVAEAPPAGEHAEAAASPKRKSKKLMIGGLLAVVIVVQVVVTYLLMPHGNAAGDHESSSDGDKHAAAAHGDERDPDAEDLSDMAEVPIGDFNFSNSTASPGSIIHVDFKLAAVTTAGQSANLDKYLKAHSARVRQLVNKIIRSSSLEELNDPNMGTIKRLIREEINRLLRKSYISEVVISDVRVIEQ